MRRQRQKERGAIALLSAIVVIAVGGFLALSLNVGHIMNARTQLQSAMDSGALGAVRSLDGTRAGADAAHNSAYQMARQHFIDSYQVDIAANASNGCWLR